MKCALDVENLVLGVSIANLGSMDYSRKESTPLPALDAGWGELCYPGRRGEIGGILVADVVKTFKESDLLVNVEEEAAWLDMVAVRGDLAFPSS